MPARGVDQRGTNSVSSGQRAGRERGDQEDRPWLPETERRKTRRRRGEVRHQQEASKLEQVAVLLTRHRGVDSPDVRQKREHSNVRRKHVGFAHLVACRTRSLGRMLDGGDVQIAKGDLLARRIAERVREDCMGVVEYI